jgi:hypothetical protein
VSAWIVSSAHIDVLVLASVQFAVLDRPGRDVLSRLGANLWAENHRSVNDRYGGDEGPQQYVGPTSEVLLDPVAVVKAIDCYVYQSCEHPQWPDSPAAEHCARLREAAMHGLPVARSEGGRAYPAGWDRAPWGIETLVDAGAGCPPEARGAR